MAKKIIQVILVIIFILLVVVGVLVGSYVFSTPDTEQGSDSRLLISGAWIDENNDRKLELFENGKFSYSENKSGTVIADGYYKINDDRSLIKLFMLPGHHTDAFKDYVNLFFFGQISYSDLTDAKNSKKKNNKETYELKNAPVCTFLIKSYGDSEGKVLNMVMPEKTLDLYSKGKHFEAKNK